MKNTSISEKTSFTTLDLSKFTPIIKKFWEDCDDIEHEYNQLFSGISSPEHEKRTIQIIRKLRTMPTWKVNLFILSLNYKTSELAEMLNVKKGSLSVYICEIKKQIRCL